MVHAKMNLEFSPFQSGIVRYRETNALVFTILTSFSFKSCSL